MKHMFAHIPMYVIPIPKSFRVWDFGTSGCIPMGMHPHIPMGLEGMGVPYPTRYTGMYTSMRIQPEELMRCLHPRQIIECQIFRRLAHQERMWAEGSQGDPLCTFEPLSLV